MTIPEVFITPGRLVELRLQSSTEDAIMALVGKDNFRSTRLFFHAYLSLLLDSPIDKAKPVYLFRKFFRELTSRPLKETVLRFASYADAIVQTMYYTSDYTKTGEFLEEMRGTPIFREYLHFTRTQDPATLRYILTFLYYGVKMDYVDPSLEAAAFRGWLEVEQELANLQLDGRITGALAKIIGHWLRHFDDSTCLPKHGPGYTAEGYIDPNDKLDNLRFDRRSRYTFRRNSFGRVALDRSSIEKFPIDKKELVAELGFVPKNVKTMRSICKEPTPRMYLQQEVMRWLVTAMGQSSVKYLIDFRDQTHNQNYAIEGSANFSLDTIDLSAASDRVHVDLVRAVFPKDVLYYLMGTRTSLVNTGTKEYGTVRIHKFAPMGSALCFPVQSIIFASVTILAHLMRFKNIGLEEISTEDWFDATDVDEVIRSTSVTPERTSRLFTPRVFGDDIICDHRITDDVLDLLVRLGLRVNSEKSFRGGQSLRESCGVYAYDGHIVTPLRFKVPTHQTFDVKAFASVIDHANLAGDFSYTSTRSAFINYLKSSPPEGWVGEFAQYLPFTEDRNAFGVYTKRVHLKNLETRESPNPADLSKPWFQRTEKRIMRLVPIRGREKSRYMEDYAYDQWFRARIRGGSIENDFSTPRVRPSATRLALGWTPE